MNMLLKDHYEDLLEILDCIKIGIYITDGNGVTTLLNKQSEKTGGMKRQEVIGKQMNELLEMGYVTQSSSLIAIENKEETSLVQELGEGGKLYITAVPLMKEGTVDMVVITERDITETVNLKKLLEGRHQMAQKYQGEIDYLRRQNAIHDKSIIADSYEMKIAIDQAKHIAKMDATVLLIGETGTGKEVLANLIYKESERFKGPFIKINCAAIPESLMESELFGYEGGTFTGADKNGKMGIFELADKGTLFLDEIGDLPLSMQSKLLRVIQEKEIMRIGGSTTIPVDVRLIAATNVNLLKSIKEGKFREDLYYRLDVMRIPIPPLRARKEDIKRLALAFNEEFNQHYKVNKRISEEAIQVLENYSWPGNVRELRSMIERITVRYDDDIITKFQVLRLLIDKKDDAVDKEFSSGETLEDLMENHEKNILYSYMEKYKNASEVARKLHVDKSTISRKLKKYKISNL